MASTALLRTSCTGCAMPDRLRHGPAVCLLCTTDTFPPRPRTASQPYAPPRSPPSPSHPACTFPKPPLHPGRGATASLPFTACADGGGSRGVIGAVLTGTRTYGGRARNHFCSRHNVHTRARCLETHCLLWEYVVAGGFWGSKLDDAGLGGIRGRWTRRL